MNGNFNPMQLLSMMRGGANPEQLMLSYLEGQLGGTPMGDNLIMMAKRRDSQGIEQVARNIAAQKGINYDEAFSSFKKNLGIK